jgi:hypothetical protein
MARLLFYVIREKRREAGTSPGGDILFLAAVG